MNTVTSRDGTTIGFDRLGQGPPVILVCGGSVDRMSNAPLAASLAERFTVFNYDRRGRGISGDTPPYAVEREIEDLEAVIDEAAGSASVYGSSSGAAPAGGATRSSSSCRRWSACRPSSWPGHGASRGGRRQKP
jgi:alpha-beta hydrolase superfamily lysophospholipase